MSEQTSASGQGSSDRDATATQRTDVAADAATGPDADVGEGQGLAAEQAHPGGLTGGAGGIGEAGDLPLPGGGGAEREASAAAVPEGDTEGERLVRQTTEVAGGSDPDAAAPR